MNKSALSTLALLAYLGAVGSAFASVSGAITTRPVMVTLTDLDLSDGVTPSISFSLTARIPDVTRDPAAAVVFTDVDGQERYVERLLADGIKPLNLSRTDGGHMTAEVSMTGREQFATHQFSLASAVNGPGPFGSSQAIADSGWYDFVLPPNTGLTIQIPVDVSMTTVASPDSYAHFIASVALGLWTGPEAHYHGESRQFALDSSTPRSVSIHELLTATYDNRSGAPVMGFVEIGAYTMSTYRSPVSTIPEPRTLPTMAIGLFLVGLWTRAGSRQRPAGH